ncbi:MAG: hypothetical protein ACI8ZM_002940 [Crocinitomix sp.]|jgi:uncharacterized protein YigE (DUF2233 family)
MHKFLVIIFLSSNILLYNCANNTGGEVANKDERFITYEVNLSTQTLKMYWKDDVNENFKNASNLKSHLETKGEKLIFAVNGGMYNQQDSPQGLYIENGVVLAKLDTASSGFGNFYMQPNGVFYLSKNKQATIVTTQNFKYSTNIQYATQSGPMLLVDGVINPLFGEKSENLNIRNGVSILPNGNAFFAQSTGEVNLYEFAEVFKDEGCENALYLDGYVSKTYLPEKKWEQLDGDFAVMIAVTE